MIAHWALHSTGGLASAALGEPCSLVQRLQKSRAIGFGERAPPALLKRVGGANVLHQVACRQPFADVGGRQFLPIMLQNLRARLDASVRQRNIAGDHNIARPTRGRDPLVGDIRSLSDDLQRDQRIARGSYPAIADQHDRDAEPRRHTLHLILNWASIGIDIKGGHAAKPTC